ncbi:MAG: carboxypeptidase-like regulatory domain-containing protein, partial [Flavobacteriaceae bacterium]|nr:carboxypeptidase-like regulatory domain-containing protein [Flavobacteriaceae bacterium]
MLKRALFSLIILISIVQANANNRNKISFDLTKVTIKEVFSSIESQTDYNFFYENNSLDLNKLFTIKVENEILENVLSKILDKKKIYFKIISNQVVLKKVTYTINGKTIDISTGEVIPFCSVIIDGTHTGTSSNEYGEFQLKVDKLPIKLVFYHLNYQKHTVTVNDKKEIEIKLVPHTFELKEVNVSNKKDFYAYELARKAFRKVDIYAKNKKYGKAYYRQKSKNGNQYSEFSEIIYDVRYSTEGIKDWDILEGRYALKKGLVNNRNYTMLSRILKTFQPNSEDLIFPLNHNIERFYKVKIIDKITSKDAKIAVLSFDPFRFIKSPILEAEAYIDMQTYELLKLKAVLKHDDFKAIKFKDKNASKKNYVLSYEIAFKKDSILNLVMDYMKVDQSFDYYKNDSLITNVISTSTLSFFDHYKPNSRKRLGRQFKDKYSDWQNLNAIGYNEKFWKENAIIKRTEDENEVIRSFERNNAFESIFINSRQQIATTQSNINNDVFIQKLEQDLLNHNAFNPVEKVYLHTDKITYFNGENIWFSSYNTLGTKHHYSLASKVLHVDLINPKGEIVLSKKIGLHQGRGYGSLSLPKDTEQGYYQIRAYTNWMRNFDVSHFFTQRIKIINNGVKKSFRTKKSTKIDLQFFPEGGQLISSLKARIAFKAIGTDGLGIDVKGKIVDSNNKTITTFKSREHGAGIITLKPLINETYTAVLSDTSKYQLPKISNTGYTMLVNNIELKNIKVKIQASEDLRGQKFYVIGHSHKEKYYQGKFEFGGKLLVDFEIPKQKLPTGVFTLTVFNDEGIPMAERVVFINNNNQLKITAKINGTKLLPNNQKEIQIKVTDSRNWPISTDLSIAVTNSLKYTKKKNGATILSQLFIQSDLKGEIENPGIFFNDQKRSTRYRLELIMLTHGWRKIDWDNIRSKEFNTPKKHVFEQGITIHGIAKKEYRILKNKNIKMSVLSNGEYASYIAKTNHNGEFTIKNFNNTGTLKASFSTMNSNGEIIEITAEIRKENNVIKLPSKFNSLGFSNTKKEIQAGKEATIQLKNDSITEVMLTKKDAFLLNEVTLKNVVVRTKKDFTNFDRENMVGYNMVPDHTIKIKNQFGENIKNLLNEIPNINYTGGKIYIRRNPQPVLWIVDGMEVLGSPNLQNYANIKKIEVLKSIISTAVYGPRGVHGIILITTKDGPTERPKQFTPSLNIDGFQNNKEFYTPKFSSATTQDYRTTLYWNPMIRTNKDGEATIIINGSKD